jgi:hypothetical protein
VQAASLDRAYLRQWAAGLDVEIELTGLETGYIKPKTT